MDENKTTHVSAGLTVSIGIFWIISLVFVAFMGFTYGKGSASEVTDAKKNVLAENTSQTSPTPVPTANAQYSLTDNALPGAVDTPAPSVVDANTCSRVGLAQKWEYLTAYTVRDGDSIQSIAGQQLHDSSRVNEILQINGVGPLVIGSTLYLPPPAITKSSGNIKEVYGKLVERDTASWHISFTADTHGQGVLIPSFLFEALPDGGKNYHIGDCLKVLFDDGYRIYTVSLQ